MFDMFHHHPAHRARQWRWVLPVLLFVIVGVGGVLAAVYYQTDTAVQTEFFRAHKTVTHTGQLMRAGLALGGVVLLIAVAFLGVFALRHSHHIIRPIHIVHEAVDALAAGTLVRVRLRSSDEFHDVADSINRLSDELAWRIEKMRSVADRIEAIAVASPSGELRALADELKATVATFQHGAPQAFGEPS